MLRPINKPSSHKIGIFQQIFVIISVAVIITHCRKRNNGNNYYGKRAMHLSHTRPSFQPYTHKTCIEMEYTLRARHKTCFLRPDTGPCRADIIQWYFDVKIRKCYRFFWGGCQGNGNRFETEGQCNDFCYLNKNSPPLAIPHFCALAFDFGTCFGQYNRWAWDKFEKTCKRRLYSGCGGNQNNFESRGACIATCLTPPNNTLQRNNQFTTCVPFNIPELQ